MEKLEVPANAPYAMLSHCWGEYTPTKLLRATLSSMKRGFGVHELPKTLQNAVAVLQRLDIEFIWIDCLGIIQDPKFFWENKFAPMSEIYTNGVINLAATAAPDGMSGLFFERDPRIVAPLRLDLKSTDDPSILTYYALDSELWSEGIENSPLN